jgi:catechol 2,3-dioxygenase-like lactoylglutathione lyase family enzyme
MAAAAKRGARFGVHSIDHFTLEVPELEAGRKFFDCFGLRVESAAGGLDLYASGSGHRWARLVKGEHKRLAYVAFNCYEKDLEPLRAQAAAAGAKMIDAPAAGSKEGFWCLDVDGNRVQVRAGPKTMPDAKATAEISAAAAGGRGVTSRSSYAKVRPRRLSHMLLFTPSIDRQIDFYETAIGLRLSDRSVDLVAFLHAPYGCDHHLMAFVKGEAKGFHHSSWDVPGIEHIGRGASQMGEAGYKNGWGTGRHVLGSNFFHYIQDPWGSFAEYSADIDYVPAGFDWPTTDSPPDDSFYLWGPDVPDYFTFNTESGLS